MKVRFYIDADGAWRWRALAANNRITADSGEGYWRRIDCVHAAELVMYVVIDVEVPRGARSFTVSFEDEE